MYTVTINGGTTIKADLKHKGRQLSGTLDGKAFSADITRISDREFHMLAGGRSINVIIHKLNREEKTLTLKVNGSRYDIKLADRYDELLHTLGMDRASAKKVSEVKAPMPGMVLQVAVKEGDEVKKGDTLLVLEAMKMENILKSPADGTVRRVAVEKGNAVEKNQLLIQF